MSFFFWGSSWFRVGVRLTVSQEELKKKKDIENPSRAIWMELGWVVGGNKSVRMRGRGGARRNYGGGRRTREILPKRLNS